MFPILSKRFEPGKDTLLVDEEQDYGDYGGNSGNGESGKLYRRQSIVQGIGLALQLVIVEESPVAVG